MSADDVCSAIIAEGQRRNITTRGQQIALATSKVEARFQIYSNPNDPPSEQICPNCPDSFDGSSTGPFQQQAFDEWGGATQAGTQCRMDPTCSAGQFYDHMVNPAKYGLAPFDYNDPNMTPGQVAQAVQRSAFPDRYDQAFNGTGLYAGEESIIDLYNRLAGGQPVTPPAPDPKAEALARLNAIRPDFNEFADWCENSQDRGGTTVDLWLIHTQEPGDLNDNDAALHLAEFCKSTTGTSNPVAYHYAGRQASDGGVTVVDMVDTDLASWSVGNSNNRAINFCFAGSSANWSSDDWQTQSKAIDVAAYLAVQDAIKYPGLQIAVADKPTLRVIPPPYDFGPPGVSDHRYCTQHLQDGNTHVDVGDNFLWSQFAGRVEFYWAAAFPPAAPAPTPTPVPVSPGGLPAMPYADPPTLAIMQLLGRWGRLGKGPNGDRTVVEALGAILDKLEGIDNSGNGDFSWL